MTYDAKIWVEVNTGRAGYVTAAIADFDARAHWVTEDDFLDGTNNPAAGGTNWTFDLFMDDAKIVGRGGVISTHQYWAIDFTGGSEIVLTKIDPATAPPVGTRVY